MLQGDAGHRVVLDRWVGRFRRAVDYFLAHWSPGARRRLRTVGGMPPGWCAFPR